MRNTDINVDSWFDSYPYMQTYADFLQAMKRRQ